MATEHIRQSYSQNRKLQPKLRMFANGDETVSAIRAEQASCLTAQEKSLSRITYRSSHNIPVIKHRDKTKPRSLQILGKRKKARSKSAARKKLRTVADNAKINVFLQKSISLKDGRTSGHRGETRRKGDLSTATLNFKDLQQMTMKDRSNILYVELGQPLKIPRPVITAAFGEPGEIDTLNRIPADLKSIQDQSGNVLIGLIDVGGYDFAHPDFLDKNGMTRFLKIWDMGLDGSAKPDGFRYGVEITQADMNKAIKEAAEIHVPAYRLLEQSQRQENSHATHVASIAAGNNGVCPNAGILGVTIELTEDDYHRRLSFTDSTRIAHAVDYLLREAEKIGKEISINISLGTNGHAHDGTAPINRWIDAELTKPGRVVCVAAGNAGQEAPAYENDMGFIMGRIHASGKIPARGLSTDLEWMVVGNTIADLSENEMEIWYSSQDRFSVSLRTPSGKWIGPVDVLEYIENLQLDDGSYISIYNELYNPANGSNHIAIYLSPAMNDQFENGIIGVPAGQWVVRLHGEEVRNGTYNAWIERDDPRPIGRHGNKELWNFPSFFTTKSHVDQSSISSLACGQAVIAVANLDEENEAINISSSQGPTRDGRPKPDIAAPGTNIMAAKGFAPRQTPWTSMTGTSMASPYVCGVAGLLLSIRPELTAAQIVGIMGRTSRPLPGSDFNWKDDAGYGAIDVRLCIQEALTQFNSRKDLKG